MRPTGGLSATKLIRARAGSGPVSFRSAVIAAPRRFDLVGLAGELRPLELRARDAGGAWSGWVPAEDGNPVYFGGADELQLRARGWRPAGTLHYVDVAGTAADDGPAGPRAAAKPARPTDRQPSPGGGRTGAAAAVLPASARRAGRSRRR